jgi:hypothetical protein
MDYALTGLNKMELFQYTGRCPEFTLSEVEGLMITRLSALTHFKSKNRKINISRTK